MRLITKDDIVRWAEEYEAKGYFPLLIEKLILASTPNSTRLRFPSGSNVYLSGWDGKVECEIDTHFVRKGISVFEIGTEKNPAKKIKGDYKKRTAKPLEVDPSEITLVLISSHIWNNEDKDKWVKQKNDESVWKEVIVYDAIDIETWLDQCIAVSRSFLTKVGKYTSEGFFLAEESWEEWSKYKKIELSPNIIVTGREKECEVLLQVLKDEPSLIGVRASTRKEAVAFIIANGLLFNQEDYGRFFSRTLVVESVSDFRMFARPNESSLILIANIDDPTPLYAAVASGHHVLMPLGAQDEFNQKTIDLPVLHRDGLVNGLIEIGFNEELAKRYVFESGRNITIIKKFIGFPDLNIFQGQKTNAREIIPMLLLGRWNEGSEGDIELIEKLSGQKYSDYSVILNRWENIEDSPIIHIANVWRLTSPLDLWSGLSKYIVKSDLETLKECFEIAFFNGNPNIESENDVLFSSHFKRNKYSSFSREGLIQSLILIGLRGDSLRIPYSQQWVDGIIHELLYDASSELWLSVDKELPLIAEASPISFLKAVSNSLEKESPEIVDMFKEEKSFFDSNYHYTGLLWALEGLAWFPEYLGRSAMILLKLNRIIPQLKLINSPMNSLQNIFIPWHFQTLANFEERMGVLKQITSRERERGWNLLIKLLPHRHSTANFTHKTRWRIFDQNTNITYTLKEIYETNQFIVELLINLFDGNEEKFSELIERVAYFPYQSDREKVYNWAEEVSTEIEQSEYKPWYAIREMLHKHRSYPDSDWALPESELKRLEGVYNKLEPRDIVEKYKWLFDRYWPPFPSGSIKSKLVSDFQEYKKNNESRLEAIKMWLEKLGFESTILLRNEVKDPKLFAEVLAEIITDDNDIISICKCLKGSKDDIIFGKNFIRFRSYKENFEWVKHLILLLIDNQFDVKSISNILVSISSDKELYDYIETLDQKLQDAYWTNESVYYGSNSTEDVVYILNKLDHYKRYFTALKVVEPVVKELPVGLIMSVLYKAASEESNEPANFDRNDLSNIFEVLYDKEVLDKSLMIKIEWSYIFLFDRYFPLKPKYLEDELTSNPQFFIDVIKWLYFPNDRERYYEDKEDVPDEEIDIIANRTKILLDSWGKLPGMTEDNSLDSDKLLSWINEVRSLGKEADRLEVVDIEIGTLLSKMPEDSDEIPSEEIFKVIEEINSKDLNSSYSMGLTNKRGSTIRMPLDGGKIERCNASFFRELANRYRIKYPNVSEIFREIEQQYLIDAEKEDNQAKLLGLEYRMT